MEWLTDPQIWISLVTLTILEIVLGIDNIIFISILAGKLPPEEEKKARYIGLSLALITRVILLSLIFWLTRLIQPLVTLYRDAGGHWQLMKGTLAEEMAVTFQFGLTGKDIVMLAGGLFLLTKSVREIHTSLEGEEHEKSTRVQAKLGSVIFWIVIIDIVFSLDSVITAVGLAQQIGVMIAAVIIAMIVMLLASGAISRFVNRHPTIKMLALSFLILVGVILVADGLHHHIEKGYIYFAMAFSFGVEMLNIKMRRKAKPVELRREY